MNHPPPVLLLPQTECNGFRVHAVTPLPELAANVYLLEHLRSGARVLHVHNDDTENLFSITFRTPPTDDTGVAHIVEHSVLSGSRKYPVRDPFFEMIKMSMATFINAMTGADCTYYPVSSNVPRDLFNLADVYFDAVFHPLLREQTLKKEGHHLAPLIPEEDAGELTVTGIVYSEMKASLSSPESLLYWRINRHLFPGSVYGLNNGGEPDAIPELTYRAFRHFHETAYHPSNAFFVMYGNIPTRDFLQFLDERLRPFSRSSARPVPALQPRWNAPRQTEIVYPVPPGSKTDQKTYHVLAWLTGDATCPLDSVRMELLGLLLLGNEASPLKKRLIDSRLGQDLVHSGFSSRGVESSFSVGLKGSEPDRKDAFQTLTLDILRDLADSTFSTDLVKSALHQAAYSFREIDTGFPLTVLQRVLQSWIYDRDPLDFLTAFRQLEQCRRDWTADPRLFNRLIRERLVENPHRLLFSLRPDPDLQAREDAAFRDKMRALRARMTDSEMKAVAEEARRVQEEAGTPNSPEALASLPQLQRSDLPPRPHFIPTSTEVLTPRATLLRNDVFANGVNYLQVEFDCSRLPASLWPAVPHFTEGVSKLGAGLMDFEEIARLKAACTGALSCHVRLRTHVESRDRRVWGLVFTLKTLDDQIEPALELLSTLMFNLNPRDSTRLHDVLTQSLAACRTRVVEAGTRTAILHAARNNSAEARLDYCMHGLPHLRRIQDLVEHFETAQAGVMQDIESIRGFLGAAPRITASFTGSDSACQSVRAALQGWTAALPAAGENSAFVWTPENSAPHREGLSLPLQVSHCCQIVPAPHASDPTSPLITLAANLLRIDYMYNEIRFKGNAYGAYCDYSAQGGQLTLGSYADPHIVQTLRVFDALPDYARRCQWSSQEIDRAVISTAKNALRPIRPDAATGDTLEFHLTGRTQDFRNAWYQTLLAATPQAVQQAMLRTLEQGMNRAPICVASSREKLEAANRELPETPFQIEEVL